MPTLIDWYWSLSQCAVLRILSCICVTSGLTGKSTMTDDDSYHGSRIKEWQGALYLPILVSAMWGSTTKGQHRDKRSRMHRREIFPSSQFCSGLPMLCAVKRHTWLDQSGPAYGTICLGLQVVLKISPVLSGTSQEISFPFFMGRLNSPEIVILILYSISLYEKEQ